MARTALDCLKSLQRYAASILPAPWDVRIALESVNPTRPFALVTQNGAQVILGKYGAHSLQLSAPYTVHAYLAEAATREAAEIAAAQLEEQMFYAFKVVGNAPSTRGDVVPLWDFVGDTTSGVNPPRAYCDYANIAQLAIRPIADPANPRLQTVAADLTLTWWRQGSVWSQVSPLTSAARADPQIPLRRIIATKKGLSGYSSPPDVYTIPTAP